jgi:hypothetical protein
LSEISDDIKYKAKDLLQQSKTFYEQVTLIPDNVMDEWELNKLINNLYINPSIQNINAIIMEIDNQVQKLHILRLGEKIIIGKQLGGNINYKHMYINCKTDYIYMLCTI